MNTRGFSTTEMLVLLASTAVLVAAVGPAMLRAQQQAQPSSLQTCQSNLKQVGLGILQYVQDYDEKYPMATYQNGRNSWRSMIQPYVKSADVLFCPSNPNHFKRTGVDEDVDIPATEQVLKPGAQMKKIPLEYPEPVRDETGKIVGWRDVTEMVDGYEESDYIEIPTKMRFIPISYAANGELMWRGGSRMQSNIYVDRGESDMEADISDGETSSAPPQNGQMIMVGESVRGDATMPMNRAPGDFARGRALFAGHRHYGKPPQTADESQNFDGETEENERPVFTNCLFADGHVKAYAPAETAEMWTLQPPDRRTYDSLMRRLSAAEMYYQDFLYVKSPQKTPSPASSAKQPEEKTATEK